MSWEYNAPLGVWLDNERSIDLLVKAELRSGVSLIAVPRVAATYKEYGYGMLDESAVDDTLVSLICTFVQMAGLNWTVLPHLRSRLYAFGQRRTFLYGISAELKDNPERETVVKCNQVNRHSPDCECATL